MRVTGVGFPHPANIQMSLSAMPRRAIALTSCLTVGCSSPITQYASPNAPVTVAVEEGRPAEVQLANGIVLKFARVRLVGDTLYG